MNIATTLPAPNLAALNAELTAGLLLNVGTAIDFAAVFETAAGIAAINTETVISLGQDSGQSAAGDTQTDSPVNLEQAMQMMAAQAGLLITVQPAPLKEMDLTAADQTVQPAPQTVNGILAGATVVLTAAPLKSEQNSSASIPIEAAAENIASADNQQIQKSGKGNQGKAFEQLDANRKTAEFKPVQDLSNKDFTNTDLLTIVNSQAVNETDTATAKTSAASIVNPAVAAASSSAVKSDGKIKPVKADETSAQNNKSEGAWENVKSADHNNSAWNAVLPTGLATDAKAAAVNIVVRQIIDQAEMTWQNGDQVIEIKLKPDSFGELQIRLTKGDDGIIARIRTDNSQTSHLLNNQITQLQESLKNKGLTFAQIDVQFIAAGSDLASRQQSQSNQTEQQKSQTRRSNSTIARSAGLSATESAAASPGTAWTRAGKIDYMA